jgi:membrane protein DedA with SNARE-associated domain
MMHTVERLVSEYGYGVITLAVLLECSGVLVPGETVFFGSAVYAATSGQLNIYAVIAAASVGAIFGNFIGYAIGRLLGEKILARHGWRVGLTERRLALGRYLFRLHGGKMVFFCRFLSLLRTFGAVLAGANAMPWPGFVAWTVAGGIAWPVANGAFAYAVGDAARHLPLWLEVAFGVVVIAAVVWAIGFVRRNEVRLEDAAMRSERERLG